MGQPTERKNVLIVARTYPTPAKRGIEVSCTAGVTSDGQWIRLFPVPYRFMDYGQRFHKYQWIDVTVQKASDPRPESYHIFTDTISIKSAPLPTANKWQARKDIVFPLRAHCLCCLKRERDEKKFPTLGLIRPKLIERLLIEEDAPDWTDEQIEFLHQETFFPQAPQLDLEKVPFKFKYQFQCDEADCLGHTLTCTDWEMSEAWRQWQRQYGTKWEAKFRQRFEADMIQNRDTHFYVGTVHGHPQNWIIIGLFYPLKP